MPRFFFHVADGRDLPDLEGTPLPGPAEARAQALRMAGEILREEGMRFWRGAEWRMDVTDEARRTLFTLRFSADEHAG